MRPAPLTQREATASSAATLAAARTATERLANLGADVRGSAEPLARTQVQLARKVERHNPRAEQQSLRKLQERLVAAHTACLTYQRGESTNATAVQAVAALDESINPNYQSRDPKEVQDLAECLQNQINETQEAFHKLAGRDAETNKTRQRLNLTAISDYQALIMLQIRLASIYASKSGFYLKKFTPSYLKSALSNSARLMNELNWLARRQETGAKTRQISTLDFDGQAIWATSMRALDIKKTGTGDSAVTHIRRGIWLHPHSRAANIVTDFIKDPDKQAALATATWKLDELIAVFPDEGSLFKLGGPGAQKQSLIDLKDAMLQGENEATIRAKLRSVQAVIPADYNVKVNRDVAHTKDPRSATRSVIHTLESNAKDYTDVSFQLTNLEHATYLLRLAANRAKMFAAEKKDIIELLENIRSWAERGDVPEKKLIAAKLRNYVEAIDEAYRAQRTDKCGCAETYFQVANFLVKERENPEDFTLAQSKVPEGRLATLKTIAELLENRLAAILDIAKHTKLNTLLIDMKDSDLAGSAAHICELYKQGNYQEALDLIAEMNDLYLRFHSPEPRYNRVRASFQQMYQLLRDKTPSQEGRFANLRNTVLRATSSPFVRLR